MSRFEPRCLATAGGPMCHTDVVRACRVVLDNFPEIPFMPILPRASYMNSALSTAEGMPCLRVDEEKKGVYFDTSINLEAELVSFYDKYLADDLGAFCLTPEGNPGFYYMLEALKSHYPPELKMIRFDIMGPITFMFRHVDENNKPIFYNETLREALTKVLAMKVRWQEKKILESFPGVHTMLNIAEPLMGILGSAFLSVKREEIISTLTEVIQVVNGLSCIHCCSNTDWALLMETGATAINFDAYEYADRVALYPKEINHFLEKGGILEWGIVPTTDSKIVKEEPDTLLVRLEASMKLMVQHGIDKELLVERALITPSCATGSMTVPLAEKVYTYTKIVAKGMRDRYFKELE